jgi:hypothetical protein
MASELIVQTLKGPTSGANANKILLGSGQELYAPGHVIQVVNGKATTYLNTTSASYTDMPGMTASITPASTSSKILITVTYHVYVAESPGGSWLAGVVKLLRGTTALFDTEAYGSSHLLSNAGNRMMYHQSHTYLDSPSSTASLTYKLQGATPQASSNIVFNEASYSGAQGSVTLMEIAG